MISASQNHLGMQIELVGMHPRLTLINTIGGSVFFAGHITSTTAFDSSADPNVRVWIEDGKLRLYSHHGLTFTISSMAIDMYFELTGKNRRYVDELVRYHNNPTDYRYQGDLNIKMIPSSVRVTNN